MDRDPYAAPKSNVRDVSPAPARHWIRTKWFYLSLVAPLAYALLGSSPWWWDALFCCLIATALAGSFIDDPILIVIGLIPFYVLVGALVALTWAIEARHCVRIYSKARGVVFVEGGDGL